MATTVVGYWNGKKEKIKQKFPSISDQDLNFYEGKEKEMIEKLEYKLGIPKLELAKLIDSL